MQLFPGLFLQSLRAKGRATEPLREKIKRKKRGRAEGRAGEVQSIQARYRKKEGGWKKLRDLDGRGRGGGGGCSCPAP